jgi:hypothetical protein
VDNIEANICSLEHLRGGMASLSEALEQGFIMALQIARFKMTKSLEDFRIMLDMYSSVTMAAKWTAD